MHVQTTKEYRMTELSVRYSAIAKDTSAENEMIRIVAEMAEVSRLTMYMGWNVDRWEIIPLRDNPSTTFLRSMKRVKKINPKGARFNWVTINSCGSSRSHSRWLYMGNVFKWNDSLGLTAFMSNFNLNG